MDGLSLNEGIRLGSNDGDPLRDTLATDDVWLKLLTVGTMESVVGFFVTLDTSESEGIYEGELDEMGS